MSEYLEAISRLNMPERTPGTTISRAQYPIPRKDTPYNYDRILKETLNTPLPKYSIPQRLFIKSDGSTSYTFPLEKQFTLAKGARKAIAIREINMINQLPTNGFYRVFFNYTINFQYEDPNNQGQDPKVMLNGTITSQVNVQANSQQINYNETNLSTIINSLGNTLQSQLNTGIIALANYLIQPVNFENINENTIRIRFNENSNFIVDYNTSYIDININLINTLGLIKQKHYPFKLVAITNPPQLPVNGYELTFKSLINANTYSLCSTMNPWSPKNIIGSLDRFYPTLNKLFPYDNSQEIKLWFIDNDVGDILENQYFKGYIDLELIIDNLNNFVMDD